MLDLTHDKLNKQINVTSPSDFPAVPRSDVVYMIDGFVDTASTEIVVPPDGLTVHGLDYSISRLFTTAANIELFKFTTESGPLFVRNLSIRVTDPTSTPANLFNNGNNNAVEFEDVNFVDCANCGTFDNYRQFACFDIALINCISGFTFKGVMTGGILASDIVVVYTGDNDFTGTVFKAGTGLSVQGRVRSNINALQMDDTGQICDFAPSHIVTDASFLMDGAAAPLTSTPFSNMPTSSTKALFSNSVGHDDTHPGCSMTITTAGTTSGMAEDVFMDLAGLATYSNLAWFQAFGDNGVEYISRQPGAYRIDGPLSFSGSNNKQVALKIAHYTKADDTTTILDPEFISTMNGGSSGTRAENLEVKIFVDLNYQDRLQIVETNKDGSQEITTSLGGNVLIERR